MSIIASSPISALVLSKNKNCSNNVFVGGSVSESPEIHLSFIVLKTWYNSNLRLSATISGLESFLVFSKITSAASTFLRSFITWLTN